MTSPISPISALSGISAIDGLPGVAQAAKADGPNTDFAGLLSQGLEGVQAAQDRSKELTLQLADGTLADPAQYTMASTEASLGLQLTMAIRNKAVEAFQEIMRMQA
jgi:flagellar hook-basal body complex protein FliE